MKRTILILIAACLLVSLLTAAMPLPYEHLEREVLPVSEEYEQPEEAEESTGGRPPRPPRPPVPPEPPPPPPPPAPTISFNLPRGWHTRTARVGVVVTDRYNVGIYRVEAKAVQGGSWADITHTLFIDISDNTTVHVQVTDLLGRVTANSVFVESFDRVRPIVRASRQGRVLRIEASDDRSGVAAIIVDGEEFTGLTDDTLEYRLNPRNTREREIWVQARDYAGNMSEVVTIANPYFVDPDADREESTQQEECTGNATTPPPSASGTTATPPTPPPSQAATTGTPPPGAASTTTTPPANNAAPAQNAPAADAAGTTTQADSGTSERNGNTASIIAVGNKQFITIQTRDGDIFYLIIDGDRASDNVYLVREVTTRDLLSFAADNPITNNNDNGGNLSAPDLDDTYYLITGGELPTLDDTPPLDEVIIIGGNVPGNGAAYDADGNMAGEDEEAAADERVTAEDEPAAAGAQRPSPLPGWIVIGLLGMVAAFAGYMFLIHLPRKKAKEAYMDDDDEEIEEDYEQPPQSAPELPDPEGSAPEADEDDNPFDIPDDDED